MASVVSMASFRGRRSEPQQVRVQELISALDAISKQGAMDGIVLAYKTGGEVRCCVAGEWERNLEDAVCAAARLSLRLNMSAMQAENTDA